MLIHDVIYRVRAAASTEDGAPVLMLDVVGAVPTGEVVAEFSARVPITALNDVARLIDQMLSRVAILDTVESGATQQTGSRGHPRSTRH